MKVSAARITVVRRVRPACFECSSDDGCRGTRSLEAVQRKGTKFRKISAKLVDRTPICETNGTRKAHLQSVVGTAGQVSNPSRAGHKSALLKSVSNNSEMLPSWMSADFQFDKGARFRPALATSSSSAHNHADGVPLPRAQSFDEPVSPQIPPARATNSFIGYRLSDPSAHPPVPQFPRGIRPKSP